LFKGVSHGKVGNHHYFLSWREPWNKFEDWDWFNGRNFCRERCMDLISLETPGEFRMFEEVMVAGRFHDLQFCFRNTVNAECKLDSIQYVFCFFRKKVLLEFKK
jgi:hypothetical protein